MLIGRRNDRLGEASYGGRSASHTEQQRSAARIINQNEVKRIDPLRIPLGPSRNLHHRAGRQDTVYQFLDVLQYISCLN